MSVNHQIVKYCLTIDGEIPEYIFTEKLSGEFGTEVNNRQSPQNLELIGITRNPVTIDDDTVLEVYETKEQLLEYISSTITEDSYFIEYETSVIEEPDPEDPEKTITTTIGIEKKVPVDPIEQTDRIWNVYLEMNNLI